MISVGHHKKDNPKKMIRSFLIKQNYQIYKIDQNEDFFVHKSFLTKETFNNVSLFMWF